MRIFSKTFIAKNDAGRGEEFGADISAMCSSHGFYRGIGHVFNVAALLIVHTDVPDQHLFVHQVMRQAPERLSSAVPLLERTLPGDRARGS